jgi:aryl-alcohol dehydrogenase-like predicted oxidoreductase
MKIEIGTAQFGLSYGISNKSGKVSKSEIANIFDYSYNMGIVNIDTSPSYGDSESVVGSATEGKKFNIITKTPHFLDEKISENDISLLNISINKSLSNLKRSRLYGALVHSCDDLMKPGGIKIYEYLCRLKDIGTIENIGVSIYNSYQLDYILSNLNVDIVQLPVSILDQRLINKGYLSILKDRGIEVHARSVFLQGLLLMNNSDVPGYFKPISNKLNQFNDECEKLLLKPLDLALSFVYSLKDVDKIVIGVESLHQLKQIVSAINNKVDTCKYEFLSINDSKYVNPSKWKY